VRIAITGTRGTLGRALVRHSEEAGHTLLHINRPQYDITVPAATLTALLDFKPDVVIHPAAYTNVDGAESEPGVAFAVNGLGTRNIALACEEAGASLIYVSTNMVFDGTKGSPYTEFDEPCPRGVYATSKRAGERYVEHLMKRFYIARISWLYGREGDSFVTGARATALCTKSCEPQMRRVRSAWWPTRYLPQPMLKTWPRRCSNWQTAGCTAGITWSTRVSAHAWSTRRR
jgi:dTDP-4-dehydrorhamnose reductase